MRLPVYSWPPGGCIPWGDALFYCPRRLDDPRTPCEPGSPPLVVQAGPEKGARCMSTGVQARGLGEFVRNRRGVVVGTSWGLDVGLCSR